MDGQECGCYKGMWAGDEKLIYDNLWPYTQCFCHLYNLSKFAAMTSNAQLLYSELHYDDNLETDIIALFSC